MTKHPIQGRRNRMGAGCDWGDGGVFGIASPSDKEMTLPVESGKEPFDRSTPSAASCEAMRRPHFLHFLLTPLRGTIDSLIYPDLPGDLSADSSGTYPATNSKNCRCHMSTDRTARFTEGRGLFPPVPGRRCVQFLKSGRYCGSMSPSMPPGEVSGRPARLGISLRAA